MPFFSPMPFEVIDYYSIPEFIDKNIVLDWFPVGTGPYMLIENNPEQRIILTKNPNFREMRYPNEGMPEDEDNGFLKNKNKKIPFIDKIIFTLEKENIPYWNKFLQGYYDTSGISSDTFDNVINLTTVGGINLSKDLLKKGVSLSTNISPTIMYWAFNMLDPIIGGYTENKKLLRQAISIIFNVEEFISIFLNGRAIAATGPIPPGIFGYNYLKNPIFNNKDLTYAKNLLSKAGYLNGIDPKTNKKLSLNFDAISSGEPYEKARFSWLVHKYFFGVGMQIILILKISYLCFMGQILK